MLLYLIILFAEFCYGLKNINKKINNQKSKMLSFEESSINGQIFKIFTLKNENGTQIKLTNYGATILSILTPDKFGRNEEITLIYKSLQDIISYPGPYFGTTPGRFANRIANGKFTLNGQQYSLGINNYPNSLHGGYVGFDKKYFEAKEVLSSNKVGVEFTYISVDGEEGYPGNLTVYIHNIFLSI
jgi:aldose 1-epimerase